MNILSIIAPIFGVISMGWIARRFNIIKAPAATSFNNLVFYIALPFLVFQGILKLDISNLPSLELISANAIAIIVLGLIAVFVTSKIFRMGEKSVAMFVIAACFGNIAYMGIPFNTLAFGDEGGAIATFIAIIILIFAMIFGLASLKIASKDKKTKIIDIILQLFKIPVIWATILGLIIVFAEISLPNTINEFVGLLGRIAGPLALFSLGMFAHENKIGHSIKLTIILALFNLLALPLMVYLAGLAVGLTGLVFKVAIIQAGMPLATTNFVFSHKFKIREKLISQSIVVSVLLAPLTLYILLFLVEKIP